MTMLDPTPLPLFPGSRAEDCFVTSLDNESGLAVIDACTGILLSFYRRSAAGHSAVSQLWLSDGWVVYATGHKELSVSSAPDWLLPEG